MLMLRCHTAAADAAMAVVAFANAASSAALANVARWRPAYLSAPLSSDPAVGAAYLGDDGAPSMSFSVNGGSCFVTANTTDPWW